MHYPSTPIDEILANEKPIKVDPEHVLVDNIGTTLAEHIRKQEKEQKQRERDANIHVNHKFCRKNKCGLFHIRRCFAKSYEEQLKCVTDKDYEKPIPETPPCESSGTSS